MRNKKIIAAAAAAAVLLSIAAPFTVSYAAGTTLYVDAAGTADATHFTNMRDAVAAAKTINPQSEAERVTINVTPKADNAFYEEQVKFSGMKYVTLQQTPNTTGTVNLSWYYCTGYSAANCDPGGSYDPNLDWTADITFNGPNGSAGLTKYTLGQSMSGVSTISYYGLDGTLYENVKVQAGHLGSTRFYDQMAALVVDSSCSDITVKDINIVNSIPVMVTQGEKDAHITPEASGTLPDRTKLTICTESTEPVSNSALLKSDGTVDKDKYDAYTDTLTAGESAFLARSSQFNERGHAISILGDKITLDGIRARGNQDSVYIGGSRIFFNNCDLIGGTDYIYGGATAVFNKCKLGLANMSDKSYGSPITAANTDIRNPYGYLFLDCTIYNMTNLAGAQSFGRPWGADAQITFMNTVLDGKGEVGKSALALSDAGWNGMSGNAAEDARFYEYNTTNNSGAAVDTSKRVVNTSGIGSVLDKWQILEFNPRNYFNSSYWLTSQKKDNWDPMNFADTYLTKVDAAIENTSIKIPESEETTFDLPTAAAGSGLEYKWESASSNAIVSDDGTKLTVVRPAAGEASINSTVTLYVRDTENGYGDKNTIPVTITPTTDTENTFTMPVTITSTVAAVKDTDFTVDITYSGALIKSQTITLPSGERTVSADIANLPAGVTYDIKVTSDDDELRIVSPEEGITTLTGVKGASVGLEVKAQKAVDATTALDINYTAAANSYQSYDLIALAQEADAGALGNVENSDIITVEYSVTPNASNASGYINITSAEPTSSCNTNADSSRFLLTRLNNSWNQLDSVAYSSGFSGSRNVDGLQWLNISGKYNNDYTTAHNVKVVINYKTKTIVETGKGTNSESSYTFTEFPEAEKGSLYLGLYPSSSGWTLNNVKVTYKKLVKEVDADKAFNMPITIKQDAAEADAVYTVTLKDSNGAAAASKRITVAAGSTSAAATIEGLDSDETYTAVISCSSHEVGLTSPKTITVKSTAKTDYPLSITAARKTEYILEYLASNVDTSTDYSIDKGQRGRQNSDGKTYAFSSSYTNEDVKELFADADNSDNIAARFTSHYLNYISGKNGNGSHPTFKLTLPAGKYKLYIIGYNHGSAIQATINDTVYTAGAGEDFAYQTDSASRVLKLYTINLDLDEGIENSTVTLDDTTWDWLPDMYAVVIYGEAAPVSKPTFEGKTIERTENATLAANGYQRFSSQSGDIADAYTASIDYSEYSAPTLKWVLSNGKGDTVEVKYDTILDGDGTVSFGLIITGSEADLNKIKSASLEVQ